MQVIRSISRRIFLWVFFILFFLCVLVNATIYLGAGFFSSALPLQVLKDAAAQSDALDAGLAKILPVWTLVHNFYIPVVSFVFMVFALILWLILRASIARAITQSSLSEQPLQAHAKKEKKKKTDSDPMAEPVMTKKEIMETNKRYYLHLLTVLQREGRMVDFFSEDLSLYEDAQIGAAVRSIQDNCKNSLKKHLNPKSVIEQNEGESISVPADFDPNAIKLTGNVTGEPPFKGIVRHKGWRASRLELPALSVVKDPGVIAPAEVEIV